MPSHVGPAGGYLAELAPLEFPSSVRWALVTLAGYFDESGDYSARQRTPCLAIAGYLASVERWIAFEQPWRQELEAQGLRFFHATDCANGKKAYRDWAPERREEHRGRLVSLVHETVEFGVSVAVDLGAYDALPIDDRGVLGHPWSLCFGLLTIRVNELLAACGRYDGVVYYRESGAKGSDLFHKFYEDRTKGERRRLGMHGMSARDKDDYPQLHPADLLAYESALQAAAEVADPSAGLRPVFAALWERAPYPRSKTVLDAEQLALFLATRRTADALIL